MKERFKVTPVAYCLLVKDEQFLLQERLNTGFMDGYYAIPAGHVEDGEAFRESIARELYEETGITCNIEDLEFVHATHHLDTNYVALIFKLEKWEGEVVNKEPHKCSNLTWCSLDSFPENTIPGDREIIEQIFAGKRYFEHKE